MLLGHLPVRPGPPREPAGVPDAALRGRRAAPTRRTRPTPARVGRLRPLSQGAARRRPVVRRAHRAPAGRRTGPVGLPRLVVDPLQGAGARDVRRAGRRGGHHLAGRALPVGRLPRRGAARRTTPCGDRRGAGAVPHQEARRGGARRRARRPGGRGDGRLGGQRRGDRGQRRRGRVLPLQALLQRLRPRHDHRHVVRRRDHGPRLHLLGVRLPRHHQPRDTEPCSRRRQAGLEGRLADALGLRARRLRAGRHGPRDSRVVVHRGPRTGRVGVGLPTTGVVRVRLRRLRRRAEDVVVGRWRPDRAGRPARPGARHPALALRTPSAAPDLRHRLRAGGRAAVRRVGRPRPQGGQTKRDTQVLAYERAAATQTRGRCRRRGSSCRSGCWRRSPT